MPILITEDEAAVAGSGGPSAPYSLAELTYKVAVELGIVQESTATGGNTTTIIDTVMRTESDDYYNQGTAWILKDTAGAAPEGEVQVVSDFTASSDTITVGTAFSASVASGDWYGVATKAVPYGMLVQKVNQALRDMGRIPIVDTSTITIAADQTEYDLPASAIIDLRKVYLQMDDSDSNDNRWVEIYNWEVQLTSTGTVPKLVLPYQYSTGYDLKLVYMNYHDPLRDYDDELSETVPLERVVWPAVLACLKYRRQNEGVDDYDDDIRDWSEKVAGLATTRPIYAPRKPGRIGIVSNAATVQEDEPNKVYLNNG